MPVRLPVAVVVLVVGVAMGLVAVALLAHPPGRPSSDQAVASTPRSASEDRLALAVLHAWDERRASAWAHGDTAALADLYVSGSTAGRADVALLRRYLQRGVTVPDLRMQTLRAAVLVDRPRRVVVRVTERIAGREARLGARAVMLPNGVARVHVVELRRIAGSWRVATVR